MEMGINGNGAIQLPVSMHCKVVTIECLNSDHHPDLSFAHWETSKLRMSLAKRFTKTLVK